LVGCAVVFLACDSFEEEAASQQIRERFCAEWAYACTDSTRVVIEDVRETRHGRQVDFRLVDRRDETEVLSAAYFEQRDEAWDFLLFEDPFRSRLEGQAGQLAADRRRFEDELMELKAAQNWFLSIYGRYAMSQAELDSVGYKPPDFPLSMQVAPGGRSWAAESASRLVRCQLDPGRQQLPSCVTQKADGLGTETGPLSQAFGGEE
jgi:hypothetical protein